MRKFGLVHIGMAAALSATTVTAVGLVQRAGAATSGTSSVYVPSVPCRLADTRPAPDGVGARIGAINGAETVNFAVWGSNGGCTIPATATGIVTNITAVNATASSYVTVFPADAVARPAASNLNVVAGGPPSPNQVTVGLSSTGAISAYNNSGTVDLIIDVVGYYQAASTGTGLPGSQGPQGPQGLQGVPGLQGLPGPSGSTCPSVGCGAFFSSLDVFGSSVTLSGLANCVNGSGVMQLSLDLPFGAVITKLKVRYSDTTSSDGFSFGLYREGSPYSNLVVGSIQSVNDNTSIDVPFNSSVIATSADTNYQLQISASHPTTSLLFCGATVLYHF
ncbi:MAG: hypothetical protein JWL72_2360 [Ilumatobacteraceae bacterium]|nr:hypothetical protein [Ilumatobacteraceae bacterium]